MRTYLIDSESNELIVDLTKTIKHSSKLVEYEFCSLVEGKTIHKESIFIRKLAGNYYCSTDNKAWSKIARQHIPHRLLNIDQVFKVYRGFKPSGLSGGASGELLTQMPGKVVKINVKVGDQVNKGDCVLILEAMKMENEIKTSVDGIVKAVHVHEGDALDSGVLMMEIE
jgi:biotin carboxyl carrier protein